MRYAIIDTNKGEKAGYKRNLHRLLRGGDKMIVNENELRRHMPDVAQSAIALGGQIMSYNELKEQIKRLKTND